MTPNTLQSPIAYPTCKIGGVPYTCRATFNSTYYLSDMDKVFPPVSLPKDEKGKSIGTAEEIAAESRSNINRTMFMAALIVGTLSPEGSWKPFLDIDEDGDAMKQLATAARKLRKMIDFHEFGPLSTAVTAAMTLMAEAVKTAQATPPKTEEPTPTLQ